MENKEIKRSLLRAHDCNECEVCQRNKNKNVCPECQFIFFEKLYCDFSSGNKEFDKIIKNPVYSKYRLSYYEWIPWGRLSNIKEIGRGGFSIIYKATWVDGLIATWTIKHHGKLEYEREGIDKEVAIKIIPANSSEAFKEFAEKGRYLENISRILGITQNTETLEYGIVMEFTELGDMRKYLSTNFYLKSWYEKLEIVWDIAHGLATIHSSDMVHRDLHSGNILQLCTSYVTIGDLGLCQPVNNEATTTEEKKIYGVIPYIPPEVLRGEKFTSAGDIYSFSMLLWELATGKPPFHDRSHDHSLVMDILYNGIRPEITSPLIPPCYAELIEKCWDVNPENRPTAEELEDKFWEFSNIYSQYFGKDTTDEDESTDEKSTIEEFTYQEAKTVALQFSKSNGHLEAMAEGSNVRRNYLMTTPIHPGAVYISRLLTLQMIKETKG
ncbi:hypothetical protein G9A89_023972 [Geosiphon pyriformis]|nr:hypothetical protein G9A89_023972 [Geosiphon pyriformis]